MTTAVHVVEVTLLTVPTLIDLIVCPEMTFNFINLPVTVDEN